MLELILNEEAWLLLATTSALTAVLWGVHAARRQKLPKWVTLTVALNLFFGVWVGIMGTGHLTAVTTKTFLGTLPPNIKLWIAIPFGFAIAVPGWWLVSQLPALMKQEEGSRKKALWLNGWLTLVLIVGLPLPILPLLNFILLAKRVGATKPATA